MALSSKAGMKEVFLLLLSPAPSIVLFILPGATFWESLTCSFMLPRNPQLGGATWAIQSIPFGTIPPSQGYLNSGIEGAFTQYKDMYINKHKNKY